MLDEIPDHKKVSGKGNLFVNPRGVLCTDNTLFSHRWTGIDVTPRFEGLSVEGRVINPDDWIWLPDARNPEEHFTDVTKL